MVALKKNISIVIRVNVRERLTAVQRTNPENAAHENPVAVVVIADEQLPANIKNSRGVCRPWPTTAKSSRTPGGVLCGGGLK